MAAAIGTSGIVFNSSSSHPYTIGDPNSSNSISGGGALNVSGAAAVTIVGANTLSGPTTIGSSATLRLGDGTTNGAVGGEIVDNGMLVFDNPSAQTIAGAICGIGSVNTTSGDGLLTCSGATTYTGPTTVATNSTLAAGVPDAFSANSSYADAGTLDINGFDQSIGSLSGAGLVTNSADSCTATLVIGNDCTNKTFSGSLQDTITTGGVLALDKLGAGTLTLTGHNTFSGDTTIDGGTLEVDNYIMRSAVTINEGGTLQGDGGTGLVTVGDGGRYLANVYSISFDDGTLQPAAGTLNVSGSIALTDGQDGDVWGLSAADAIFKELTGSVSVQETSQTYALQGWGNIDNGAMTAPAFEFNPDFSYTDGAGAHDIGPALVFDEHAGLQGAGTYNADAFQINWVQKQVAIIKVTNMAPVKFSAQGIVGQLDVPQYFAWGTVAVADARGGAVYDNWDGTWTYLLFSPQLPIAWDPYHPWGGGPDDDAHSGASFSVTLTSPGGQTLHVDAMVEDQHGYGYVFHHYGRWIDQRRNSTGGILLAGGSTPTQAMKWFVDHADHGDILVIGNTSTALGADERAEYYGNVFRGLGARSVDVFNFTVAGGDLSDEAFYVATNHNSMGTELIDKLSGAEGVWFAGGDQFPYVRLLRGTTFGQSLEGGINLGWVTVGGNSAGMAALPSFVYTAQYTRGDDGLTSRDVLANMHTPLFYQNGRYAITNEVLHTGSLFDIVTDTHFAQRGRLGRFLCFLGATLLSGYTIGQGDLTDTAIGIAADEDAALAIEHNGTCQVFGANVFFAEAFADGNSHLGLTQPDPINNPSKLRLRLDGIVLEWYSQGDEPGGQTFAMIDAFDPTRVNQRAIINVRDGQVIEETNAPEIPGFTKGLDYYQP